MPISPDIQPNHSSIVASLLEKGVDVTPAQQVVYTQIDKALDDAKPVFDEEEFVSATGCGMPLLGA